MLAGNACKHSDATTCSFSVLISGEFSEHSTNSGARTTTTQWKSVHKYWYSGLGVHSA